MMSMDGPGLSCTGSSVVAESWAQPSAEFSHADRGRQLQEPSGVNCCGIKPNLKDAMREVWKLDWGGAVSETAPPSA